MVWLVSTRTFTTRSPPKAKYDAQTARQEYLKIQLRAQGHRKKCAEYKQWLDSEQAKLDEAIQELEPARAWDEEARQILEDIIHQQEQEQLHKDTVELDMGGPADLNGPPLKRSRLAEDAASVGEVPMGGDRLMMWKTPRVLAPPGAVPGPAEDAAAGAAVPADQGRAQGSEGEGAPLQND